MKAILWTKYGPPDGLQLQEVEKPAPADHEVLVRIYAATATAGDCEMRSLKFPLLLGLPLRLYTGFRKPERIRILGQELAGVIEAVGKDVRRFQVGDAVFGALGFGMGAYAEYICLPETPSEMGGVLALKPANMSFAESAAVPVGSLNALHFLRKANLRSGESVLINGAGGSIGTIAVQLARHYGAEVTAVDSTHKLEMLREIGASTSIDYTQEDFAKRGQQYDVIFDIAGKGSFARSIRSLKPNGRYLMAYPGLLQTIGGRLVSMTSGKKVTGGTASYRLEHLESIKALIETGKIKAVIDRTYPLAETADAHRYVETGQKKGNVVITC